jgi:hypothetical protein
LRQAVRSVEEALVWARDVVSPDQVEMLVGFDGVKGRRFDAPAFLKFFDLPVDNDWGNGIRSILLKAARGERIVFLDDDNALKRTAFLTYSEHPKAEMLIGRIDTQLAFDHPYLPVEEPGKEIVRHTNIDPLCVCLSADLVVNRCGGWSFFGRYEADYLNIFQYYRRARSVVTVKDVVGVYDAGRNLDAGALSRRQMSMLERLRREREQGESAAPVFKPAAYQGI